MVWEFQLPTIVMLTELVERGIVSSYLTYNYINQLINRINVHVIGLVV